MEEKFIELFKETLEIDGRELSLEDEFRHYDEWDSLSQLSLIAMLDDEYGVEIENEDFVMIKTLGDLIEEVKKRKNGE
jgi:acyl carrier protein